MKAAWVGIGLLLALGASGASGNPREHAVQELVKAIAAGADLGAAFPGAIAAKEVEPLRRLAGCEAHNLMERAKGRYTVVWWCHKKLALAIEVLLKGDTITSVSTMEVYRAPRFEGP